MINLILLKQRRKQNGWTQAKVAKMINKSQQAYAFYENGTNEPDIETIKKLCKIYNVELNEIVKTKKIFNNIRELRISKKLKQTEVAKMLNKSQQAYSKYEQGTAEPDLETIEKICQLYNCSPNYLLGFEEDKSNVQFDTDATNLGKKLEKERNKKNLTQRNLALKAGLSNGTISRIEHGIVTPDTDTLSAIAKVLSCPVEYFLGESELIKENMVPTENSIKVYGRGTGVKTYKVTPKRLKAIQALLEDDDEDIDY